MAKSKRPTKAKINSKNATKKKGSTATSAAKKTMATSHAISRAMLKGAAAAWDHEISEDDTVEAVTPLLSVQPLPPVVIPAGTQGTVTNVDDVGNTKGYLVDFDIDGATRNAPAFQGQIRLVS